MKTSLRRRAGLPVAFLIPSFVALLLSVATAAAAPLTQPAPVYAQPDSAAPVLTTFTAGTEPAPAPDGTAPAGWLAVRIPGPHEGYVLNKDINKALEVRPGAPIHREPRPDASILATAALGDPTEILNLRGRWTQIRLNKDLIGYLALPAHAGAVSAPSRTPLPLAPASPTRPGTPTARPPSAPAASTSGSGNTAGAAVALPPAGPVASGDRTGLARLFQGTFASTRRPLAPRRPFDYALVDAGGTRIAYLDTSRLHAMGSIDSYLDRTVVVFGALKPLPDTQDVVIVIESLQVR